MATRTPPALRQYSAALRMLLALTVIVGLAYPLAMTGLAQVALGSQANGSMLSRAGTAGRVGPDRPGVHPTRRWSTGSRRRTRTATS